jgi:uncharacterized protein YjdB
MQKFIFALIFLVFFAVPHQAQILFQDIADQTVGLGQVLLFDVDNDSNNDLALSGNFANSAGFFVLSTPTAGNVGSRNVQMLSDNSTSVSQKLTFGQVVGANAGNFISTQTSTCVICVNNSGAWVGGSADAYLGFRLEKISTNQIHYGWLRVSVSSTINQIIVKEIGFQRTANADILIGFIPVNTLQINGLNNIQNINTDDGALQMQAQISPQNASNQLLNWTVDNPVLASIDAQGILTALANGSVLVRSDATDGSGRWDTTTISITNQVVNVNQIIVNPILTLNSEITARNGSLQMQADAQPIHANNRNILWSVDNKNIATIDQNGLLTAKQNGTVRVVATSTDGGRVSGYETVQISGQTVFVNGLTVQGSNLINSPNGTISFFALVSPFNADIQTVTWAVDSPQIAEISSNGVLQAHKNGSVRVRAKSIDGSNIETTTIINITNQFIAVDSVRVSGVTGNFIYTNKGMLQMNAFLFPNNANNRNFHWEVDSPHIAEIRPNGQLFAKINGIVNVRAVSQDNSNKIGVVPVQISNQIIKTQMLQIHTVSGSTLINTAFGGLQLIPVFIPQNTSNQNIIWVVNNPNLADISNTGMLFAKQNGTVTVTAISQDGSGQIATINIIISGQLTLMNSLQIQGVSNISIPYGTAQLSLLYSPANATQPNVVYICDRPNIAVVSPQGLVQALGNGTATITAIAQDGSGLSTSFSIFINNQQVLISTLTLQSGRSTFLINQDRDTLQLYSVFSPSATSPPAFFWKSSNPQIATVSNNGLVSAVANGNVTISSHSQDGSGLIGRAVLTISNQNIPIQNINITTQAAQNAINNPFGELQLWANVTPANASNNRIVWSVDSPQIAYINPQGILIAKKNGIVNVRAQSADGSEVFDTANFYISNQWVEVEQIEINASRNFININADTLRLFANISPNNPTNGNFIWFSNQTNIATIAQNGVLTAQNNGIVEVIAISQDFSDISDTFLVTITNQNIAAVSLSVVSQSGNYTINTPYGNEQLLAIFSPISATSPSIFWTVNNPSIATINSNGLLTALSDGIVVVTARAYDENTALATTTFNISNQNTAISNLQLSSSTSSQTISSPSGTLQLVANIIPSIATNQNLLFKSLSANIAQVTQTGQVFAYANGVAQIVAYTQDGSGISDTINITISNQFITINSILVQSASGITFINTGAGTLQMQTVINPANSSTQNIGWAISDTNLATISALGVLKAKSNGTVRVFAYAADGSNISGFMDIDLINQPIWVQNIQIQGQNSQNFINVDNQNLQMEAVILPANATNNNIRWQIAGGGTGWATINANTGILSPRYDGIVTVRATSQDGSRIFGEANITISNQSRTILPLTSLSITAPATIINIDKGNLQMSATLLPNATNRNRTWTVTPSNLATIDQRGILQAVDNGQVTVTVSSFLSGLTANFVVTISNQYKPIQALNLTSIGNINSINTQNGSIRLQTNIIPTNASNNNVFYTINQPSLAHISQTGEITAFANGTVIATAHSLDGSNIQENFIININNQREEITSLSINSPSSNISSPFGSLQIGFMSSPISANVVYSVSDLTIAKINAVGRLTALKNGIIWVKISALDGSNLSDSAQITITNQPILTNSISLTASASFINQNAGQTQLLANIIPSNASNQNIIWFVNNENLATIANNGLLTAKNNGIVSIYALSQDGSGAVANFSVTISNQNIAANNLAIATQTAQNQIIQPFGNLQMLVSFFPNNASNQTIVWSVDNPLIALIQPTGKLYALENGLVTVKASSRDGSNFNTTFQVLIQNQPIKTQNIIISKSTNSLLIDAGIAQLSNVNLPLGSTQGLFLKSLQTNLANINRYGMLTALENGWCLFKGYAQDSSGKSVLDSIFIDNQHQTATSVQISAPLSLFEINQPSGILQLTATAIPNNLAPTAFRWQTANPAIAQIYPNGLLIGKTNGIVTITAIAQDGSNTQTTQTVTVTNQSISTTGLILTSANGANTINAANSNLQIIATIQPNLVTNQNVYFFTNNSNIATINQQGLLVAKGNGVVAVQARALDGSNITDAFMVTVSNQPSLISNFVINSLGAVYQISSSEGSLQFQPSFNPAIPTNTRLAWSVSGNNLAYIDENGLLTAYQNGIITVSARSLDGSNFTATRTVTISNQSVYINSFAVGSANGGFGINTPFGQNQFTANPAPANASNLSNVWWVANSQIASISTNGLLRAHQNGTVMAYLQALDRGKYLDSFLITISNQPVVANNFNINAQNNINTINIFGGFVNIIPTFAPALISNPNIAWSVDNPQIAKIDENGKVTALGTGNGQVLVFARVQDKSGILAICTLNLNNQIPASGYLVSEIDLFINSSNLISLDNGSLQLLTNVFPQNAANQNLTWSTENSNIATIDAQGLIRAQNNGNIMAFAHSSDGSRVSALLEIQIANQIVVVQRYESKTEAALQLQIFPNPIQDYFNISLENADLGDLHLQIYDLTGQLVFQRTLTINQQNERLLIENLPNLPTATYVLKIQQAHKQKTALLIKK